MIGRVLTNHGDVFLAEMVGIYLVRAVIFS